MWYPFPATTLCFADLEHTLIRLNKRTEKSYEESYHIYYLELYVRLAKEFDANILRTDQHDLQACLVKLTKWYKTSLTV